MTSTPDKANRVAAEVAPKPPVRIYHNPSCTRSREALEYVSQQGYEVEVVEYLKTPPSVEELRQLLRMLGIAPSSLIRIGDFKRLGLSSTNDYEKLLKLITENPVIMDRPIVVVGSAARIGRPLETLHELFSTGQSRRKP